MKTNSKNIFYSIREICRGSGTINLLSISWYTLIIYALLTLIANRNLFRLLAGMKGSEDYSSIQNYITFLENQRIDNTNMLLVPCIVTIILFIAPSPHLKTNIQNRLLPISPWTRVVALLLVTYIIGLISMVVVNLLDLGVLYYVQYRYLPELIALQESLGDLYKQHSDSSIFSDTPRHLTVIGIFSASLLPSMAALIMINLNLIFKRYNKIKGAILIAATIMTAGLLREAMQSLSSVTWHVSMTWTPTIYFFILLGSLVFTLYYALKEREE